MRAFAGTLNRAKAIGHLLMVLGLVELALTSRRWADWDYARRDGAKGCWDRPGAGEGETEINRLFYRLGWTKGWYKGKLKDKRFGEISEHAASPDWKTIKTKLLEMGRTYDQVA